MTIVERLRRWAHTVRRDVHAVWLASRDRRTPWYAKTLAVLIAAYALSPIDLIPDFIPALGYVDDLILLPLAILLVIRLIPAEVLIECRVAAEASEARPNSRIGAGIVIALWALAAALLLWALWPQSAA